MKTLHVVKRSEWRSWLQANHENEKEVWLVFFKKHTGRQRLAYDDAVEEALCFGWIDSIVRRLDDERYAQKFTPRRAKSNWSDLNVARAKRMIAAGAMIPAGLARIDPALLRRRPAKPKAKPAAVVVPAFIERALAQDESARAFFTSLAPSYRRLFILWVASAKREDTRQRRLAQMLATLRARRRLGLK